MKASNIVRARVIIKGTRPLLQHAFGPESLPLEKGERTGVAGNDPTEWKKTCMVNKDGQLYIRGTYVFGCIRDASKHTKKGKGSIQAVVAATLQVEESIILIDRFLPKQGDPSRDPTEPVYLDVCGVRNPSTKARNVRYRLACSPGWSCSFTILFDKTLVAREVMRSVLRDASILVGVGDGRSVGNGRFEIVSYTELTDAEEATAEGSVGEDSGDRLGEGQEEVSPVSEAAELNGVPHRPRAKREKRDKQAVES
jgi:hypothetical protein